MASPASFILICSLCNKNTTNQKLGCKHEFCSQCIRQLEEAKNFKCPLCKKLFSDGRSQAIDEILANKIKEEKEQLEVQNIFCKDHLMLFTCWCKDCMDITCYKCLLAQHKTHDVESIDESVHMRDFITDKMMVLKNVKNVEIDKLEEIEVNLKSIYDKVEDFERRLSTLKVQFKENLEQIRKSKFTRDEIIKETEETDSPTAKNCVLVFQKLRKICEKVKAVDDEEIKLDTVLSSIICAFQVNIF